MQDIKNNKKKYILMLKKITLTKDHLKLIPFLFIQEDGNENILIEKNHLLNIGSHLLEDMSIILGLESRAIEGTKNDADGRAFDDESEKYMMSLYEYLTENLFYIETLIHQFAVNGGLSEGTYKCLDNELLWEKE